MTLTPLYDAWIEQLASQQRMSLILLLAAGAVIAAVLISDRNRETFLRWAAAGYLGLFFVVIVYGLSLDSVTWRPPRFGWMMDQALWYDEGFTALVSALPLDRMMAAVAGDVHPPTWYLISSLPAKLFPGSEVALRVPALLFGAAAIYLCRRLALAVGYSQTHARWSAILLAVLPGQVYYAQEARMYTLLECAVLVAALGLVTRRLWVMAVGILAALYTQNLAVFYVAVVAGLALWRCRPRVATPTGGQLASAVTTLSAVGLLWLPWAAHLVRQASDVADGFWIPDYGLGGYVLEAFMVTTGIGQANSMEIHQFLLFIGMVALAGWYTWRERDGLVSVVALLTVGPPVLMAITSELWRPVFLGRALLPSLPFLAILVVGALSRIRPRLRRVILTAMVFALGVGIIWPSKQAAGAQRIADDIAGHYRSGDVIYHGNLASYILLSYYLPDGEYRHAVWPDAGDLSQALTLGTQRAMGIPRRDAAQAWEKADRLLVVWVENPTTTAEEIAAMRAALALGCARPAETWSIVELATMRLWEVRRGECEMYHLREH